MKLCDTNLNDTLSEAHALPSCIFEIEKKLSFRILFVTAKVK